MTEFILHGGFALRESEHNITFWQHLVRNIGDEGVVLVVAFAVREDGKVFEKFNAITARIKTAGGDRHIQTILASKENFMEQIALADAVYIQGGSTSKLLSILKVYPELVTKLKEKKVVAGSSAGAYALVKYGASHSEKVAREGLGCVFARLICHYDSLELPPNNDAVELLRESDDKLPLIILKDFEWRAVVE